MGLSHAMQAVNSGVPFRMPIGMKLGLRAMFKPKSAPVTAPIVGQLVGAKAKKKSMGKPSRARTGKYSSAAMNYRVGDAMSDGVKAWNFIRKYLNVETKIFDSTSSGPTDVITYSGTTYNLSNIAQGNDYNNREGNSILVQKMRFAFQVASSNTASQVQGRQILRVMIIRDMLQNGVDPVPSTILETTATALAPFYGLLHIHDSTDDKPRQRFRILYDRVFNFNPNFATNVTATGTGAVDLVASDNHFEVLHLNVGAHTTYQGTTGADASNFVGGLYCMAISNTQTNGPVLTFVNRVYFTDN
jgi:hypothetical protein